MLVYLFILSQYIGSKATDLWLIILFVVIFQDVIVLQTIKIWFMKIVMYSLVSEEANRIKNILELRFQSIINRKKSIMSDALLPIQHFNVACRVARKFPQLASSRLLMSLNDYDVPKFSIQNNTRKLSFILLMFDFLNWNFNVFMNCFTRLPINVQDLCIEIMTIFIVNFFVLGLYYFGKETLVGVILFSFFIVLFVFFIVYFDYFRKFYTTTISSFSDIAVFARFKNRNAVISYQANTQDNYFDDENDDGNDEIQNSLKSSFKNIDNRKNIKKMDTTNTNFYDLNYSGKNKSDKNSYSKIKRKNSDVDDTTLKTLKKPISKYVENK
jgi:hypothetical protein